jgi:hypothetical protein
MTAHRTPGSRMRKNGKFMVYGVIVGMVCMTITLSFDGASRLLIVCGLIATVAAIEKLL